MLKSIYPVLLTEKLEESNAFYKAHFGFTEAFTSDWYISLSHPDGGELALIDARHDTIPEFYQSVACGMLLNIEVEDATQMYNSISDRNSRIIMAPLRDEDYGQRHFMVQDPNGILIDIIQEIAPSQEYLENYTAGE